MTPKLIPLKEFLKKDLLAYHIPNRDTTLETFKEALKKYREKHNRSFQDNEGEENFKNNFNELIKSVFLYDINSSKRIDSAIRDKDGYINTLIEAKSPFNTLEMISDNNLNKKAFHEALLYFYQQTVKKNVTTINNVFITDCRYLFVFSVSEFKKLTDNKGIAKILKGHCDKEQKMLSTTKDTYNALEAELENLTKEIEFCVIDLFEKTNNIEFLYRLLDKYSLFNINLPNDNNTLNEKFYKELLYIMGLEEAKDPDKTIDTITYKKLDTPENGSLMKLVLDRLDTAKLKELPEWEGLADTDEKRTEEVALELVLTWINRILFLKLLEAQLISYHKGIGEELIEKYRFLSPRALGDWHKVYELFFDILSKPLSERGHQHIPYLNSSLFEKTPYEDKFFSVDALKPHNLTFVDGTILKKTGAKPTLSYLLEFLDAYDFGSGDKGFVSENRLINASVLGLVFEKINGYREGAVYTPGFITMSMSKEALTHTVIQKFNDTYGWDCKSLSSLKNKIIQTDLPLADANRIFNSIRICDPAVGSGHFLVSCLNELLRLKYELKILSGRKGELISHCDMSILHDELLIAYNGKNFTYEVNAKNTPLVQECQSLQEALFHEKETLIENCLFGVDINPKSAYICQLRLWIELLKNTYYIQDGDRQNLQTLPNIDINIKCGNSLIFRFPLRQDFTPYFSALKSHNITIEGYQEAVALYKNSTNKSIKAQARQKIDYIKEKIRTAFLSNDTAYTKLQAKYNSSKDIYEASMVNLALTSPERLAKEKDAFLQAEAAFKKAGNIYHNSLEWRYEFPEVLDENGVFLGFDLIIGNPPYFRYGKMKGAHYMKESNYLRSQEMYKLACVGEINAYGVFLLLSYHLCKEGGFISEIFQNSFLADTAAKGVRKHYIEKTKILQINSFPERDNHKKRVFENVKMSVLTLFAQKTQKTISLPIAVYADRMVSPPKILTIDTEVIRKIDGEGMEIITLDENEQKIFAKCYLFKKIDDIAKSYEGELHSANARKYHSDNPQHMPFLVGANLQKYYVTDMPSQRTVPLYFDSKLYMAENTGARSLHHQRVRLAYQGISGINDKYRIIATIIPAGYGLRDTANYIIPNDATNIYYLLGLLNSWLLNWLFKARSTNAHTNTYEIKRLPIPQASPAQQAPIIKLVQACMDAKAADPKADISATQAEIDKLVYGLYGLTEDEIKIVEGRQMG